MKQKKKLAKVAVLCTCVLGIVAVITLAVSKNSESVENIFAYGNVNILLKEDKFNAAENNVKKVMTPLSKVDKDPVIVNIGKNDAVVFLKVEIPKAKVYTVDENKKVSLSKDNQQLFNMITTYQRIEEVEGVETEIEKDLEKVREEDWKLIIEDSVSSTEVNTYVYGYNKVLKANKNVDENSDYMTSPLFDKVQLINILETDLESLPKNAGDINVYAYAIQADNILINNQKVTNDDLNRVEEEKYKNLINIYNKYVNNS